MAKRKALLVALTTAAVLPLGLSAQMGPSLETGALRTSTTGSPIPVVNVLTVAPGLEYRWSHLILSGRTAAWLDGDRWQIGDGELHGTLTTPVARGIHGEVLANANRAFDARSLGTDQMDVQTRVHVSKPHGGFWLGVGTARPWRVAVVSSVDVANLGVWGELGTTNVTTTFTRFNFTKRGVRVSRGDETTCGTQLLDLTRHETLFAVDGCRERSRFSDIETSVRWEFMGLEYSAKAGYRSGRAADVGADSRRWGAASVSMWVAPRMAFVVSGGRQPDNPSRLLPAQTFGTMGLVFAYLPSRAGGVPVVAPTKSAVNKLEVRPVSVGVQKILVRLAVAETVEVMGDFTNWEPLALVRRGKDLWEVQLPIRAGSHRINVRVDGGTWTVPPGMTSIKDGFGGEVGLFFVER